MSLSLSLSAAAPLPFPATSPFHFFGIPQTSVYLCNNGLLSFGYGVSTFIAEPFPILGGNIIAPL